MIIAYGGSPLARSQPTRKDAFCEVNRITINQLTATRNTIQKMQPTHKKVESLDTQL